MVYSIVCAQEPKCVEETEESSRRAEVNADTADGCVILDGSARTVRVIADVGDGVAIPVTTSLYMPITCAGTETNTLAIPGFIGQWMFLTMDVDGGGDRVVTAASAINIAGQRIVWNRGMSLPITCTSAGQ